MGSKPPEAEEPDPGAFARFTEFTRRLIAVPKAEIDKREKIYRKKRAKINAARKPLTG